ncbi:hypothetical protein J2847_006419 [Azospirillum agricola]|uniref:hypothetical protein n=1 Tax=Azospirillum agricola TaxID=1720247 RepID=UPI001AE3D800|nr:hypothetical protein [Azospirillum agricola]MBP2233084.1 hypothetical protein [Azospirillum agricola]
MSTHTVAKPFSTPTRRFAVGQPVTEADITGPLSFAERVALGQIAAPVLDPVPAAEPAPKPAKGGKAPTGEADPAA